MIIITMQLNPHPPKLFQLPSTPREIYSPPKSPFVLGLRRTRTTKKCCPMQRHSKITICRPLLPTQVCKQSKHYADTVWMRDRTSKKLLQDRHRRERENQAGILFFWDYKGKMHPIFALLAPVWRVNGRLLSRSDLHLLAGGWRERGGHGNCQLQNP